MNRNEMNNPIIMPYRDPISSGAPKNNIIPPRYIGYLITPYAPV